MYTDRSNVCVIVGHGVTVTCNLWTSNGTLAVVTSSHSHSRPVVRRSPRGVWYVVTSLSRQNTAHAINNTKYNIIVCSRSDGKVASSHRSVDLAGRLPRVRRVDGLRLHAYDVTSHSPPTARKPYRPRRFSIRFFRFFEASDLKVIIINNY